MDNFTEKDMLIQKLEMMLFTIVGAVCIQEIDKNSEKEILYHIKKAHEILDRRKAKSNL